MPFGGDSMAPPSASGDEEIVRRVAQSMQALAAPNRVRILSRLGDSPCSVSQLVAAIGLEQSAVSHHLTLLRRRGLVVSRRRGREVIYALHRKNIRAVLGEAVGQVERSRHLAIAGAPATMRDPTPVRRELQTVTYIIAEPCIDVKDKSCIDVCPVDCIHEFDRILVIDPEECIDCGACEPECPVEAIYPEDTLPDRWEPFVKINYAYPDGDAINTLVADYSTAHNVHNSPLDAG